MREKIVFLIVFRILLLQSLLSLSPVIFAEPPIELIYFKASDVEHPNQSKLDLFHDTMIEVQSFFASEMERHNFGPKTFDFNPEIKVVRGNLKRRSYADTGVIQTAIPFIEWGLDNQVYVVFFGGRRSLLRGSRSNKHFMCEHS